MEQLKFFQDNWGVVSDNSWIFLFVVLIAVSVGFSFARYLSAERVESLKERVEKLKEDMGRSAQEAPTSSPQLVADVQFPQVSVNGRNLLSPVVQTVQVGERLGVRAVIPPGRTLLLKIEGLGPQQSTAAWSWTLGGGTIGWVNDLYDMQSEPPRQSWSAGEGVADLTFKFSRKGEAVVSVMSDDGKVNWSKNIRVQ